MRNTKPHLKVNKFLMIALFSFLGLLLASEGVFAQASDPDLNNDGVVNILDVSMVGSCFGQSAPFTPPCDVADTDGNGDVNMADINYVVASFGQSGYPVGGEEDTTAPTVTINSPANLSTVGSSPVTVTGTVDETDAALTVNGVGVPINPDGSYTANGIVLNEGGNPIVATAIDAANNVGTSNITIFLDSTPPNININTPLDGFVSTSSLINVSGSINDIVIGTVNQTNATVEVNGIQATVSNGTFLATDVPLVVGDNTITAMAADQTGNTDSMSINVVYEPPQPGVATIGMLFGNNQTGVITEMLPVPLKVFLTGEDGTPAVGETVVFKITQNNGLLTGSGPATSLAEVTDANGEASVSLALGSKSGQGNNKVEATAVGYEGSVIFTASATEKPPHKINIGSGNNQRGAVDTPLPDPLVAVVTDDGHNVIQGIPVTFTVVGGGGNINGSDSVVVNTDSDGRATIVFTLGPQEGFDNHIVEANFDGNTTAAAIFKASGFAAGDPGDTKISGIVLDNTNNPIPGVTMRVEGTTREGVTDAEGQFLIESVPVGHLHLIIDGSTATIEGEFPVLSFEINTIAGQNNTLGLPIYLLPLNTSNIQWVGGDEDAVYELDNIPGFSLNIKANSVTFPDGSQEGYISVTQVHADKVPMPPPNGLQPRFIITVQPPGAVFDPPAPITIPNVDGLAPGEITEMYSFDHDLGQFVIIGLGTVSGDGSVVASDPGFGIRKAGWHCGGNPVQTCCTGTCPTCKKMVDPPCECRPDNLQVPSQNAPDDCMKEVCLDGSTSSTADDSETPSQNAPDDCKKEMCQGGSTTSVSDDSENPSNVCKECQDGAEVNKPDGTEATEDKCKICKDGQPENIDLALPTTASLTIGLPNATVSKINDGLGELTKIGVNASVAVNTLTLSEEIAECCEPTLGKGNKVTGSVTGTVGKIEFQVKIWPPGPIPTFESPEIFIGIATIKFEAKFLGGLFAGVNASLGGQISKVKDECSLNDANRAGCIQAQAGITLEPLLNIQLTGEACALSKCLFCDEFDKICGSGSAKAEAKVTLNIGNITYNKPNCGDGLSGGVATFGGAAFDVTASFQISGKIGGVPFNEGVSFNFLSCNTNAYPNMCSTNIF